MTVIDEIATIPIYAAIIALPAFVGLVSWISFIAYTSSSNAAAIIEIKTEGKDINKEVRLQLSEINSRLSRIETKLEQRR